MSDLCIELKDGALGFKYMCHCPFAIVNHSSFLRRDYDTFSEVIYV